MRIHRFALPLIVALAPLALPAASYAAETAITLTVAVSPPALLVDEQPAIPGPGYLWTPGYWAYTASNYYWVPGAWVEPPAIGLLWTPGYWDYSGRAYAFRAGYWGPTVGFYGGIDYGFGYTGVGYSGGRWEGRELRYNSAVNHLTVNIHNTYNERVTVNANETRVAFHGGKGGTTVQETAEERTAARAKHSGATENQAAHEKAAVLEKHSGVTEQRRGDVPAKADATKTVPPTDVKKSEFRNVAPEKSGKQPTPNANTAGAMHPVKPDRATAVKPAAGSPQVAAKPEHATAEATENGKRE
jgi:hypothetical protein